MLKSYGVVVGGWVAWSNLVSAQGPLVLDLGLKGLGPGLDNKRLFLSVRNSRPFIISMIIYQQQAATSLNGPVSAVILILNI